MVAAFWKPWQLSETTSQWPCSSSVFQENYFFLTPRKVGHPFPDFADEAVYVLSHYWAGHYTDRRGQVERIISLQACTLFTRPWRFCCCKWHIILCAATSANYVCTSVCTQSLTCTFLWASTQYCPISAPEIPPFHPFNNFAMSI